MNDKPKPVRSIRIGSVQAAVWSNPGQHGPIYNVTIDRRYRDDNGEWQSAGSFNRDDLLGVAKVADLAHTHICERQSRDRSPPEGSQEKGENGTSPNEAPSTAPASNGKPAPAPPTPETAKRRSR